MFGGGPAQAAYTYTYIDYPGQPANLKFTDVRGINNNGLIVGYAFIPGSSAGAFIYAGGGFSPLPPAPGFIHNSAGAINDNSLIVGSAGPAGATSEVGYIFSPNGYTFFSHPNDTYTYGRGVNNAGLVTGYGLTAQKLAVGFIYNPATQAFTDILPPFGGLIVAQGINQAGQVVGSAPGSTGQQNGFLRDAGTGAMHWFQVNGQPTSARGINDSGLIAGYTTAADGFSHPFVGDASGYQVLDLPPGSQGAFGEALNNNGQISGVYYDADFSSRGFIASPAVMPIGTNADGAYMFSTAVARNKPLFIDPAAAQGYAYKTRTGDPNFATVRLPIGAGDSYYTVMVGWNQFPVAGGTLFDFRQHGYASGVNSFKVTDIETSAALNAKNPEAFVTELTFMDRGRFSGSMGPLCLDPKYAAYTNPNKIRLLLRACPK